MASRTVTGGRKATTAVVPGRHALSIGDPKTTLPDGWAWRKLTDLARLESGHTPSRKRPEYWDGGVPWIGIKDATGNHGRVLDDTLQHVSQLGIEKSSARVLPEHTVCLSRTASVGYVVVMGRPMATSQDFVNWVCGDELDWRFLKYVLLAETASLRRFAYGTTHQTIYFPEVKALHVAAPSLAEQQRIVSVLGAVEDKIESNLRAADLLSECCAQLCRQLSQTEGSATARSIYDIARVTYGAAFKSALFNESEGMPLIRVRDVASQRPTLRTSEDHPKTRVVRRGDIVVGMDGEFRAHAWAGPDAVLNQRVCVFDPLRGVSRAFLLEAIKRPLAFFEATKGGTTVIHLGKKDIDTFEIAVPDASAMRRFGETVDPLLSLCVNLRAECRVLEEIRDTLLPKLISGAIRVPPEVGDTTSPAAESREFLPSVP